MSKDDSRPDQIKSDQKLEIEDTTQILFNSNFNTQFTRLLIGLDLKFKTRHSTQFLLPMCVQFYFHDFEKSHCINVTILFLVMIFYNFILMIELPQTEVSVDGKGGEMKNGGCTKENVQEKPDETSKSSSKFPST